MEAVIVMGALADLVTRCGWRERERERERNDKPCLNIKLCMTHFQQLTEFVSLKLDFTHNTVFLIIMFSLNGGASLMDGQNQNVSNTQSLEPRSYLMLNNMGKILQHHLVSDSTN